MYAHTQKLHTHDKDPAVHVKVRRRMETQHGMHKKCQSRQNAEDGRYTEVEEKKVLSSKTMIYFQSLYTLRKTTDLDVTVT